MKDIEQEYNEFLDKSFESLNKNACCMCRHDFVQTVLLLRQNVGKMPEVAKLRMLVGQLLTDIYLQNERLINIDSYVNLELHLKEMLRKDP